MQCYARQGRAQSWLTFCDFVDCSPPGSYLHGIFWFALQEYWNRLPSPPAGDLTTLNPHHLHWEPASLPLSQLRSLLHYFWYQLYDISPLLSLWEWWILRLCLHLLNKIVKKKKIDTALFTVWCLKGEGKYNLDYLVEIILCRNLTVHILVSIGFSRANCYCCC